MPKIKPSDIQSMHDISNVSLVKLRWALRLMGKKYLKTQRMKDMWTDDVPTTNYCYVVSEFVYWYALHNLPKKQLAVYHTKIPSIPGITHWFIVHVPSQYIIDLTADQFDDIDEVKVAYTNAKRGFFIQSGRLGPSKRAIHLARIMGYSDDDWQNVAAP